MYLFSTVCHKQIKLRSLFQGRPFYFQGLWQKNVQSKYSWRLHWNIAAVLFGGLKSAWVVRCCTDDIVACISWKHLKLKQLSTICRHKCSQYAHSHSVLVALVNWNIYYWSSHGLLFTSLFRKIKKYSLGTGNIISTAIDTAFIYLKGFRFALWTWIHPCSDVSLQ